MRVSPVLVALPVLLSLAVAGDPPAPANEAEIVEHIDKGREALKAGNSREAIDHLQKAISLIQKTTLANLATFLPTRDERQWEMGEIEKTGGNWASEDGVNYQWTQVTRNYRKKGSDDAPEVNVTISNSPQIVQGHRQMLEAFKDPAMRALLAQGQPGQKQEFIDKDGWIGTITFRKEDASADVVAVHEKVIVTIHVEKDDGTLAKSFWDAIDLAKLGEATAK
jgi:hypothetical protein